MSARREAKPSEGGLRARREAQGRRGRPSARSEARCAMVNDQAQADAADRITATYENVKTDILLITALLFLLALGTGLYTFAANKKTFAKLQHLAEQLQAQSGQLRKLSWKLIEVQEETLRRVARDLHDEFGQILTAIGVMLNRAGRKAHNPDPALMAELEYVKSIVEETLSKVRDQSQMFRPGVLDDFGLDQTLEWFTRQFSRQAGIQVHFSGPLGSGRLPPEESIHVYRIVQEALNNVARHSRATEAWVEMEERERAEHLKGTLNIQSTPGNGTAISVRIPLKKTPEARVAEKVG